MQPTASRTSTRFEKHLDGLRDHPALGPSVRFYFRRREQVLYLVVGGWNTVFGLRRLGISEPASATAHYLAPVHEPARQLLESDKAAAQSKLMRSFSTTSGRWYTWVWIDPMYSPNIPMKKSCTLPRKYTPITSGAKPRSNVCHMMSFMTR